MYTFVGQWQAKIKGGATGLQKYWSSYLLYHLTTNLWTAWRTVTMTPVTLLPPHLRTKQLQMICLVVVSQMMMMTSCTNWWTQMQMLTGQTKTLVMQIVNQTAVQQLSLIHIDAADE